MTPVEVIAVYLADIHHDRTADPVRRSQAEDLLAELAGAGHVVVSAEDLRAAADVLATVNDPWRYISEEPELEARLRAVLPERSTDLG